MYKDFANIYDELMKEVDYHEWADYLYRLFLNAPQKIETILEFGCGTGNITCELAKMGYNMTAVDISEEMLIEADNKARQLDLNNIKFFMGDMSNFKIDKKFDAVISCCDSVNYLKNLEEIQTFLYCSYDVLKENGVFMFDINTTSKYKNKIANNTFVYDLGNIYCVWENMPYFDENRMEYELVFFVSNEHNQYFRYDEKQSQYLYKAEDIFRNMKAIGFKNIKIYNFGTFNAGGNENDRIIFVAEKA